MNRDGTKCLPTSCKPRSGYYWVWGSIRAATYERWRSVSRALIEGGWMDAYCVKCKGKKEMKDAQKVKMKNGRSAMKGTCPDCGTGLYRILSK